MARWEFKLPDIGEGVTEGEIVQWHVRPGDVITEDQPMVEVMTDKATVTITAPKSGTILETRGAIGEIVKVHSVLLVFDLDAGAPVRETNGHVRTDEGPAATAVGDIKESLPGLAAAARPGTPAAPAATGSVSAHGYFNEKPLATPATRKLARDMNVDLRHVPPSGPQGRVTKKDVESFSSPDVAPRAPGPAQAPTPAGGREAPAAARGALEERIPFAGLRRKIAQHMAQSKHTAAHFTFVEECDATELKEVRARLKGLAEAEGVRLTFLPFVVKACVAALKKHPMLNATLDEANGQIVLRKYFHIGIATATAGGLIVPVVKDADRRNILDIAREIERVSSDARAGKAKLEDLQGSTFTITSLGAQAGLLATPIINFPEVGILGVHQIKQKPVVKNGQIVVGEVMLLSLSFDHRIVDGHVGAAFAYEVIKYLEQPDRFLLELT